jgi:hypothetical protein
VPELIYEKYGTRVCECDEEDERLRKFIFDGTRAMAECRGWELLPGAFERIRIGRDFDGEQLYAYLWPVAREAVSR